MQAKRKRDRVSCQEGNKGWSELTEGGQGKVVYLKRRNIIVRDRVRYLKGRRAEVFSHLNGGKVE
jgi:hypothetical protein